MQSQTEAEAAAYSCVLAEAERHMRSQEPPDEGRCCDCAWFTEVETSGQVPGDLARRLQFFGLCVWEGGAPVLVDRSERHEADECWEEARL